MKTLLAISLLLVLTACSKREPGMEYDRASGEYRTYVTQEELEAQIEKCKGFNGTLMGYQQDRGERMGQWYDVRCDFKQHPESNSHSTDEVTTEGTTESWSTF